MNFKNHVLNPLPPPQSGYLLLKMHFIYRLTFEESIYLQILGLFIQVNIFSHSVKSFLMFFSLERFFSYSCSTFILLNIKIVK